jgi:hypothetical protein
VKFFRDRQQVLTIPVHNQSSMASDSEAYKASFVNTVGKFMALKIVDNFDGSFTLDPEAKATLEGLLTGEAFLQQVTAQLQCQQLEFTQLLFQPIPYSTATPKGMPAEYEQYHESDDYTIVNVPPNFMFKAKIFNPSRLCAIYRKIR